MAEDPCPPVVRVLTIFGDDPAAPPAFRCMFFAVAAALHVSGRVFGRRRQVERARALRPSATTMKRILVIDEAGATSLLPQSLTKDYEVDMARGSVDAPRRRGHAASAAGLPRQR